MRLFLTGLFVILCAMSFGAGGAWADELKIVVNGVEEPMLGNVRALIEPFQFTGTGRLTRRRLERMRLAAESDAQAALRPYGYYLAVVTASVVKTADRAWTMTVDITPGSPVVITVSAVNLDGPGKGLPGLRAWRDEWPLKTGKTLLQPVWDSEKHRALEIAADSGYLLASFPRRDMLVDLERNEARLDLLLDTGERAVMGEVRFHQDIVRPYILENLPRFQPGEPYNAWMMERFRIDLWRAGYFQNIKIMEDRQLDASPPRVDMDVRMEPRKLNTYQGALGFGSDTGARIQFSWNRHLLSERGDSFSLGTGWQNYNNEFFIRGNYRLPRRSRARQWWVADAVISRENEDLKVTDETGDETLYKLGASDINDYRVRLGRLRTYDRRHGYRRWFETWYAEYLYEQVNFQSNIEIPVQFNPYLADNIDNPIQGESNQNLSLGVDYEMPFTRGQGFETEGLHLRGWAFISDGAWGSDRDFSQLYVSGRWNGLAGARWKLLARVEAGYSDADVNNLDVIVDGNLISLSVTELPNHYRFKAGGSTSVRGYGFEQLSNNNIGSNNIVTASIEAEYRIFDQWSLAAFIDVGNAFNDWSGMEVKKGVGVGVRWYTIAGAMRVDVAQALDLPDKPWRIHFTIGSSVL